MKRAIRSGQQFSIRYFAARVARFLALDGRYDAALNLLAENEVGPEVFPDRIGPYPFVEWARGHTNDTTAMEASLADVEVSQADPQLAALVADGAAWVALLDRRYQEAVVAAIYLDSNVDAARRFLEPLYAPLIDEIRMGRAVVEDPKTTLQEFLQARNLAPAQYLVTAESGPEHRKTFQVALKVGTRTLGEAMGTTKKKAELDAAQTALARLKQEEGRVDS